MTQVLTLAQLFFSNITKTPVHIKEINRLWLCILLTWLNTWNPNLSIKPTKLYFEILWNAFF